MINFLIRFYGSDNKILYNFRNGIKGRVLLINNEFINSIIKNIDTLNISDIICWDMYIKCESIDIIIDNYDLTDNVCLLKASDGEANVNLINSKSSSLHFVGLNINLIQTFDSSILLADCIVTNFDLNIENFMNELENANIYKKKYESYILDIRNSIIKDLSIYSSIKNLNIQESTIHNIEFRSSNNKFHINNMSIWNGTTLNFIRLNCEIDKFNLEDSDITKLYFTSLSKVHAFTINKSYIERVFGCDRNIFDFESIDVWKLIKKSSFNDNEELYYDSCYKIAQIESSKNSKVIDWFYRNSIGYGYKPSKAIIFISCCIFSFGFIYSLIDLIYYLIEGNKLVFTCESLKYSFKQLVNRIYFSGITFTTTGYGDISPSNYITKYIAIVEACLGVTMFSLLIYSLTKRHFDK